MAGLYDDELKAAREQLTTSGRDADAFAFAMDYLPPEEDFGGGMFAMQYEVVVTAPGGQSRRYVGSVGHDWVAEFASDLSGGAFG